MNQSKIIKDLKAYGVIEAGQHSGNIESFKGLLDKFHSGELVKEGDMQGKTVAERNLIQEQIERLELEILKIKGENEKLRDSKDSSKGIIPLKLKKIENLQNEIDLLLTEGADKKKQQYQTFQLSKYLTYWVFIIPLSIYLIFFYTAIANSAFYGLNPNTLISGDSLSIPILPTFDDLREALRTNYMLIVVPSVFFCFGVVLHIFVESESKIKYLLLTLVILMTLIADGFLAFKIHQQATIALNFMMEPEEVSQFIEEVWYKDVNFYIVLIMGFVVFIIWSIIYHAISTEWAKRNVVSVRNKIMDRLKNEISEHEEQIIENETKVKQNSAKIDNLKSKRDKEEISSKALENNINEFTDGWNSFLSTLHGENSGEFIKAITDYKRVFIQSVTTKTTT